FTLVDKAARVVDEQFSRGVFGNLRVTDDLQRRDRVGRGDLDLDLLVLRLATRKRIARGRHHHLPLVRWRQPDVETGLTTWLERSDAAHTRGLWGQVKREVVRMHRTRTDINFLGRQCIRRKSWNYAEEDRKSVV